MPNYCQSPAGLDEFGYNFVAGGITSSDYAVRIAPGIYFSFGIMALTAVPYVVGLLASTPQLVFGGVITMVEDQYSCSAKMVQGGHGLFHLL